MPNHEKYPPFRWVLAASIYTLSSAEKKSQRFRVFKSQRFRDAKFSSHEKIILRTGEFRRGTRTFAWTSRVSDWIVGRGTEQCIFLVTSEWFLYIRLEGVCPYFLLLLSLLPCTFLNQMQKFKPRNCNERLFLVLHVGNPPVWNPQSSGSWKNTPRWTRRDYLTGEEPPLTLRKNRVYNLCYVHIRSRARSEFFDRTFPIAANREISQN